MLEVDKKRRHGCSQSRCRWLAARVTRWRKGVLSPTAGDEEVSSCSACRPDWLPYIMHCCYPKSEISETWMGWNGRSATLTVTFCCGLLFAMASTSLTLRGWTVMVLGHRQGNWDLDGASLHTSTSECCAAKDFIKRHI